MKILAISDVEHDLVKSSLVKQHFADVDMVLACGDLSITYLEYVATMLGRPVYFVHGNHTHKDAVDENGAEQDAPGGCYNLHGQVIQRHGVLVGGLEGSMRYREGDHQYSDLGMFLQVFRLVPRLWRNRLRYGRALDILITHAPPFGIHDAPDLCHRGFRAFLWLMQHFQPLFLVHGHIHLYRLDAQRRTQYGATTVLNAYGYQVLEVDEKTLRAPRSRGLR